MTKRQKLFSTVFFVLLGAMFCLLFYFSAQDGEDSTSLSNGVILAILKIFVDDFETISLEQQTFLMDAFSMIIRKIAHFSIFFVIGILTFFATYMFKTKKTNKYLIMAGICSFYAVFDELHQYFIPERTASFSDVIIDLSGSLFGVLLIITTFAIVKYVHKTESSV